MTEIEDEKKGRQAEGNIDGQVNTVRRRRVESRERNPKRQIDAEEKHSDSYRRQKGRREYGRASKPSKKETSRKTGKESTTTNRN